MLKYVIWSRMGITSQDEDDLKVETVRLTEGLFIDVLFVDVAYNAYKIS